MGGKKAAGENSKKAAGNARVSFGANPAPAILPYNDSNLQKKADAAASKKAAENAKLAAQEDKEWSKGSKTNAKKYDKASSMHETRMLTCRLCL